MAIPDAILHKPGPLDAQEWAFMRRHTLIGERILSAAPALVPVAKLVRSSHERFDGGGYPDGLAGDEIPLGSRIVAVCDAYDAMTSDRSYRRAMSRRGGAGRAAPLRAARSSTRSSSRRSRRSSRPSGGPRWRPPPDGPGRRRQCPTWSGGRTQA